MATDHRGLARAVVRAAAAPVDARWLGIFRSLFGALVLVAVIRFWAMGWIADHFVTPRHFLPAIEGLGPLPTPGMYVVFAVLAIAALGVSLGVATRTCAAIAAVAWTYQHLADRTNYLNHYYLVSVLLLMLALLPTDAAWSLRAMRHRSLPRTVPRGVVWAFRVQVGLVYVFAGIAKLGSDWLLHAQPLRIWLGAHDGVPVLGTLLAWPATAYVMSWVGAAFDLSIVPLLSARRTRAWAYGAALGFHALTGLLFPLGMFPWIMAVGALVFFPARGDAFAGAPASASERTRRASVSSLVAAVVVLHLCVQLLAPLRFLAFPGNVLWTERGFRWSWRVMVVEKAGVLDFDVREPSTGRVWSVSPRDWLTPTQARMASFQPDLIVALARRVARDFARRGHAVEVRANAFVSLDGRPAAALLDPHADLSRDDLDIDRVLMPSPSEPPP